MNTMGKTLKIGDKVWWSGFFGSEPWREAYVKTIKLIGISDKGDDRDEIPWELVRRSGVTVDLTNGYWAYGTQIAPYGR